MKRLTTGKKWFIIVAVVLFAAVLAAAFLNTEIPVKTAAADRGQVKKILKETGTVESGRAIIVIAKNPGEIKRLLVEEGNSVKAGDLLMSSGGTSTELDIKSLQAELSGLRVQYGQAKDLADKNKVLYEQGAMSYADYSASNTAAKQLAAQVTSLQYAIKSYAVSSGAAGITAPADGVITGVYVKEGESVTVGIPLLEISDLNEIYIKADFIAEDADLIREGDSVRVYNENTGFSDEKGTVKKIHLKAENKMSDLGVNQKRVTVEVLFGTTEQIRLGSNMNVDITVEKKDNVLRISDLAVFEKERKNCVYVIEEGKAVLREIETGLEGEDYIEVISGLSEGNTVILSPGNDIEDGVRVKAQ
ncbi:MAG: efflux RND transporter periplasmic adaptor subunit [Eubacteriales bacterium]|nr:efflux RND transporter periplasmic adaptor subunit [Eubacteriales bacterium]